MKETSPPMMARFGQNRLAFSKRRSREKNHALQNVKRLICMRFFFLNEVMEMFRKLGLF